MRAGTIFAVLLALATLGVFLMPGNRALGFGSGGIVFAVWGAPWEDRLFLDRYALGFEERTGIEVDYQRHSDLQMKYNVWQARGLGAEVMRVRITDYRQYVRRGMIEPLSAYINDPEIGLTPEQLAQFPPGLMQTLTIDGELYALPEDSAQFGLYYNRAIFDAYNRAHPDDPVSYPDESWTWADLRRVAAKLTDGGAGVRGFDMFIWEWPYMQFFLQAGGEFWSEDELTTRFGAGEAALDAFAYLGQLVLDGSWDPYVGKGGGVGPDSRFASGRTAMLMTGSWWAASFDTRAPDLDYAIAVPPRGRSDRNIAGCVLWAIGSASVRKRDGWRMLRWLVDRPQAAAYWDTLRVAPPAHLGVVNSPDFRSTAGVPKTPEGDEFLVAPMPAADYDEKAAWIRTLMMPDPETGRERAYVPVGAYQARLELEIRGAFTAFMGEAEALADAGIPESEQRARLARVARGLIAEVRRGTHEFIDRDRIARGLGAVRRGEEDRR